MVRGARRGRGGVPRGHLVWETGRGPLWLPAVLGGERTLPPLREVASPLPKNLPLLFYSEKEYDRCSKEE